MSSGFGVVAYLGAWLTTIGGVWFLFEKADETLSAEIRSSAAEWLTSSSRRAPLQRWPGQFVVLFDRLFGERHLTLRCFRRSAVASLCTVWLVTLVWAVWHPPANVLSGVLLFVAVTFIGILFNLIPDYLSLLETRWVLSKLAGSRRTLPLLLADFILTGIIGISVYVLFYPGARSGLAGVTNMVWDTVRLRTIMAIGPPTSAQVLSSVSYAMPMGVFFYATYFTSAWVWLFAVAGGAVRAILAVEGAAAFLWRFTDVKEKPFRSLGLVAVLLVTATFVLAAPLVFLLGQAN